MSKKTFPLKRFMKELPDKDQWAFVVIPSEDGGGDYEISVFNKVEKGIDYHGETFEQLLSLSDKYHISFRLYWDLNDDLHEDPSLPPGPHLQFYTYVDGVD